VALIFLFQEYPLSYIIGDRLFNGIFGSINRKRSDGMKRSKLTHNFNAGPSALPLEVLERAQEELVDFKNTGMSIMEMSHRGAVYEEVHNQAIQAIRELFNVPEDYDILFLQGGASLQFSMIPMNFLQNDHPAGYVLSGSWSEKALDEAKVIGNSYIVASTKEEKYRRIPSLNELEIGTSPSYLHVTSNNTIYGTQWSDYPDTGDIPLIGDMSSDILCKPIDVSKFSLIYGGAQKNLGPSGVTLAIIKKDYVAKGRKDIPTLLQYRTHSKNNSLYNTPPTFSIYMLGLVMDWVKNQGGVEGIYKRNIEKAQLIYNAIDESNGFYKGHAEKSSRSLMNITFTLSSTDLEKKFLAEAEQAGFVGLAGHRSVGGCRASAYNSVPVASCQALREFMIDFSIKNG
jgi:phosphoserine aminotransferase